MCLKLVLDLTSENENENDEKELEQLEKDVNELLAADPDTRWKMTMAKFDFSKNL